tara:strand:+ start:2600 stop:3796 length:1197 start_codon:yes stop_codon:yes gene_type:complete
MIETFEVRCGDSLDGMRSLPDASVDAVVSDPPYGINIVGKQWDRGVPGVPFWSEALRVAKLGAYLLAFCATRTVHRLAVAIEDAGWEIRDMPVWCYSQGFPKSLDVSKAIDKRAGADRRVVGTKRSGIATPGDEGRHTIEGSRSVEVDVTAPATPEAIEWDGWGTALKPAIEPIVMARKPLDGTVAENVLEHGTGAINVAGCSIGSERRFNPAAGKTGETPTSLAPVNTTGYEGEERVGRWPTNLIHDGSPDVLEALGSASRMFYCAKPSGRERDAGLSGFEDGVSGGMSGRRDGSMGSVTIRKNTHATVKPTALMAYLCRLVARPGALVLDPFCGSGSTGRGAVREGMRFLGFELEDESAAIARARIEHALRNQEDAPIETPDPEQLGLFGDDGSNV